MALEVGDIVTKTVDCPPGDERELCSSFPFGTVREIQADGTVMVQSCQHNARNPHPIEAYNQDEITRDFDIVVNFNNHDFIGTLAGFGYLDARDQEIDLIDIAEPNGRVLGYHIDYFLDGTIQVVPRETAFNSNIRKRRKMRESARNIASMRLASRGETTSHLNLPNNARSKVLSYISGYNVGKPNERTHQRILEEALYRAAGAPGAGVNVRYGPEVEGYIPPTGVNFALEAGPLPYGPSEENFTGGRRKTLRKKKKSRKTLSKKRK